MTEKPNPPEDLESQDLESQPDPPESTPAEASSIGPGRPPPDRRWQKGGPSPNPRGRPRKGQSIGPDLRKAFEQAVNQKVAVSRGGKKALMTRVELGLEQLLNQVAKGDRHARRELVDLAERIDFDLFGRHKQAIEDALAPSHQAILDDYVARRTGITNVAPAEPELAPPELFDDDLEEMKQPESSAASAPVEAKQTQPVQRLDQASRGRGVPPPGGFSVTTKKWS